MRLTMLRSSDLGGLRVRKDEPLRTAMQEMNESGRTFVLVTTGARLEGVLADGDIRRHLARGGAVDDPAEAALNRTPITLPDNTDTAEVRAFMVRRGLEYLPLVHGADVAALCILEHAPRTTDMTAVILAGGLGTRLAPLTDDCPKPLLPLGGKPILTHILEHLKEQGIHRFVLSVNYLANMVIDHYDDGSDWDCFIDYVKESKRLGTGGPLSLLDRQSLSEPFLCINGDVLNDVDIGALRETHVTRGWDATMVVRGHSYTVPYGVVETGEDGQFLEVREKPVQSFQINAGVYMLSRSVLDVVPADRHYDLPTLFEDLPARGLRGGTYLHTGRWIDIGSTTEYERAKVIFEKGSQPA